jgi:hypothetical protein
MTTNLLMMGRRKVVFLAHSVYTSGYNKTNSSFPS